MANQRKKNKSFVASAFHLLFMLSVITCGVYYMAIRALAPFTDLVDWTAIYVRYIATVGRFQNLSHQLHLTVLDSIGQEANLLDSAQAHAKVASLNQQFHAAASDFAPIQSTPLMRNSVKICLDLWSKCRDAAFQSIESGDARHIRQLSSIRTDLDQYLSRLHTDAGANFDSYQQSTRDIGDALIWSTAALGAFGLVFIWIAALFVYFGVRKQFKEALSRLAGCADRLTLLGRDPKKPSCQPSADMIRDINADAAVLRESIDSLEALIIGKPSRSTGKHQQSESADHELDMQYAEWAKLSPAERAAIMVLVRRLGGAIKQPTFHGV